MGRLPSTGQVDSMIDVQIGRFADWQPVSRQNTMTAPSGGGQSATVRWGTDFKGKMIPLGLDIDGNPEGWTFNVSLDADTRQQLLGMLEQFGQYDSSAGDPTILSVRQRLKSAGNFSKLNEYETCHVYRPVRPTSYDMGEGRAESGSANRRMTQGFTAGAMTTIAKLVFKDETANTTTRAMNSILVLSDSKRKVVFSDYDTSNPYSSLSPRSGAGAWSTVAINAITTASGNVLDAVEYGDLICVVTPVTPGGAWVTTQDLIDGTSTPWTAFTGISTQFPNAIAQVSPNKLIAVGTGGYIWTSSDGKAWTALDAGVTTTNALTSIAVVDEQTVWAGGASGTLVLIEDLQSDTPTLSVQAITGTPSDSIDAIAVPPGVGDAVFFGTDAGDIYRSKDVRTSGVTAFFETIQTGLTAINALSFTPAQFEGGVLWAISTDGSSDSTVWRDLSGGAGGQNMESYTTTNNGWNSIFVEDSNRAWITGEIQGTNASTHLVTFDAG